ncbi:MAG: hypothetical protein JSU65_12360 [Candidatus Zixiibacteriota bacterium]|nr:MAG: hypothetical protein JSU65_12360 [candidate division Zixibacteria bacterium]
MKRLAIKVLIILCVIGVNASAQIDVSFDTAFTNSKGTILFPLRVPSVLDLTGAGARAQGMGNAFYSISDDISAISWNPAGLSGQERPTLGFGLGAFAPSGEFETTTGVILQPQAHTQDETLGGLTMLTFLAPVRIKGHPFTVAASYSRSADEYDYARVVTDTMVDYTPLDDDTTTGYLGEDVQLGYHSRIDVVNFGFGTGLSSNVTGGVSINIYTNKSTSDQRVRTIQDGVTDFFGQPREVVQDLIFLDTSKYSGVNFTLGLKMVQENLAAGLVVKTPFSLQQKTNRTVQQDVWINNIDFTGGMVKAHFDRILTKIEMPLTVGAGLSYTLDEALTLAGDVEYRNHAGGKMKVRDSLRIIPGERDTEYFTEYNPRWKNVFAFRTGAEYVWTTGFDLFPVVPLRVGFSYVPIPTVAIVDRFGYVPIPTHEDLVGTDEYEFDSLYVEEVQHAVRSYSLGVGVRWSQIKLDVAFTHSRLSRGYQYVEAGTKNSDNNFNFTFTGYFE